jgi:hypothetical protein
LSWLYQVHGVGVGRCDVRLVCWWCESREEPVVSAVLVDFECHEETSAERDQGKDCATTEGGYAHAHALFVAAV